MQEDALARRVVHFLSDEMVFVFRTTQSCEGAASATPQVPNETSSLTQALASKHDKKPFVFRWAQIVFMYTKLRITYRKEILPALSRLAKRLEKVQPGRYLAGIWERDPAH